MYFSSIFLRLVETDLYTISLASELLKCDECFATFDFLMNVKVDFYFLVDKNAQ